MIKIENTEVFNFKGAIRGMRNPLNSWDKSDSKRCGHNEQLFCEGGNGCKYAAKLDGFCIGANDLKLAQSLAHNDSDHRKLLRQIMVSVDITAPRYWWAEFDTYKVGTVANSCSTMHTIHKKEFELDDFSFDGLLSPFDLRDAINKLNTYRELYLQTKEKNYWRSMIILLPQSYNQKRTVTLNYEVLLNQYHARKNHKLSEWHTYCDWIKSLPYFKEICLEN